MIKEHDFRTGPGPISVPVTLSIFLLLLNVLCITPAYGQISTTWQPSASALFRPLKHVQQSGFVPLDQPNDPLLQAKLDSESLGPGNKMAELSKEMKSDQCGPCLKE